jgi:hypothetical protein
MEAAVLLEGRREMEQGGRVAKSLESEKKQGSKRAHYLSTFIGVQSSTTPYNRAQPN